MTTAVTPVPVSISIGSLSDWTIFERRRMLDMMMSRVLDLHTRVGGRIRLLDIMIEKGNRNGSEDFLSPRHDGMRGSEATSSSKGNVLIDTSRLWLSRFESRRRLRSGNLFDSLCLLGGVGLGMGSVTLFLLISP